MRAIKRTVLSLSILFRHFSLIFLGNGMDNFVQTLINPNAADAIQQVSAYFNSGPL
jgi:hypothetical protein